MNRKIIIVSLVGGIILANRYTAFYFKTSTYEHEIILKRNTIHGYLQENNTLNIIH